MKFNTTEGDREKSILMDAKYKENDLNFQYIDIFTFIF